VYVPKFRSRQGSGPRSGQHTSTLDEVAEESPHGQASSAPGTSAAVHPGPDSMEKSPDEVPSVSFEMEGDRSSLQKGHNEPQRQDVTTL